MQSLALQLFNALKRKLSVLQFIRLVLRLFDALKRNLSVLKLIGIRWLNIVVYAVAGTACVALLAPAVNKWAGKPFGLGLWALVPLAVLGILVLLFNFPRWWHGRLGLRHFLRYPPVWLAGLWGLVLLWFYWAASPSALQAAGVGLTTDELRRTARTMAWLCGGLSCGVATASELWRHWTSRRRTLEVPQDRCELVANFGTLRAWLVDDRPIDAAERDAFEHTKIASRIAMRVTVTPPATVAVLGRLGSGKSSIRNLLKHQLKAQPHLHCELVDVSVWPYRTQEAAILGILDKLVNALSAHVSTLPLRGLPMRYIELLEASGGASSKAARLLRPIHTPESLIGEFDDIAQAIGKRFIVWVEDVERFSGGSTTAKIEDSFSLVRSALYLLDERPGISVLLATTHSRARFDVEKLARFVEQVPQVKTEAAASIIAAFARGCITTASIVHIGGPLDDLFNATDDADDDELLIALMGRSPRGILATLADICTTPRHLKQALRACLEKWQVLAGEIDFQDLLVMSTLREAEAPAFDMVVEHLDELRSSFAGLPNADENVKKFWERLQSSYSNHPTRYGLVRVALESVFDKEHRDSKPQGLAVTDPRDYWERFLSVPQLTGHERDQAILLAATTGDVERVAECLGDPLSSRATEVLCANLDQLDLLAVLDCVVAQRCAEFPANWSERVPGVMPIWRMMIKRRRKDKGIDAFALHEHLIQSVNKVLPVTVVLVLELMRYFTTTASEVENLLHDGVHSYADVVNAEVHRQLSDVFEGDPEALALALRGERPHALLQVCWTLDRIRLKQLQDLPFPDWAAFAATLLQAVPFAPEVVLPQLACFVAKESPRSRDNLSHEYEYDPEAATRLFGDSQYVLEVFRVHSRGLQTKFKPLVAVLLALDARAEPVSN